MANESVAVSGPYDVGGQSQPVLELDEEDFARALGGKAQVDALAGRTKVLDGADDGKNLRQRVTEQLPRVLARKLQGLVPENFVISSIEMKIGVDAKVFGTGVSGEAVVTFGPAK